MNPSPTPRKIGITELITHVGDENIKFQVLQTAATNVHNGKQISKITFGTDLVNGYDLARAMATGGKPDVVGLIVWLPRDKMLPELQ